MSQNALAIDGWLDLALNATRETVEMCLEGAQFEVVSRRDDEPKMTYGTMLPLVTHSLTMYVCLFSSEDGCASLARNLLGMEPADGEITGEAMRDAVGEIVNILAGVMQTQLGDRFPGIELALPCFLNGKLVYDKSDKVAVADVRIGEVDAELLVFGNSKAA